MAALLVLAFVAPLVMASHCKGEHEENCATECACACCCAPVLGLLEQTGGQAARCSEYAGSVDMPLSGRLLPSDIFRPPAAA